VAVTGCPDPTEPVPPPCPTPIPAMNTASLTLSLPLPPLGINKVDLNNVSQIYVEDVTGTGNCVTISEVIVERTATEIIVTIGDDRYHLQM
jgi:hypothetical protein